MAEKKTKSVKERIAGARLPERSLQVCLRGDLVAEFDALERDLAQARDRDRPSGDESRPATRRQGQRSEVSAITGRMDRLREAMAEEMLDVRVRALPRREWQRLVSEHPPKDGHENDQRMGVDFNGLMGVALPLCVIEPGLDAEDWERLDEALSSGDYDRLVAAVWDVNRSAVNLPESRLASLLTAQRGDGLR